MIENVKIHIISYDADLEPETQPWRQVQEVVDGKLDIAGVWGPFAGYVLKTMQGEPLTIVPVNLMDDEMQLEFDLALGMRRNDVVLKYMLDNALEKSKDEIKQDPRPITACRWCSAADCVVSGDIPSHGTYFTTSPERARNIFLEPLPEKQTTIDKSKASADQIVTNARVEEWLKEGSDLDQELSNAVVASDRERVAFLLGKGADISKRNLQGLAPLHTAARQRDSDMIAFLIEKGADVNERDKDGWTPLLHASFRNHVPSVAALAKSGADLNEAAPGGLHAALGRHRRGQVLRRQGPARCRRQRRSASRRRRAHALDADRKPAASGAADREPQPGAKLGRHRENPNRRRRRRECQEQEGGDPADGRGGARQSAAWSVC